MNQPHEVKLEPYIPETQEVENTQLAVRTEVTLFGTSDPAEVVERAGKAASALADVIRKKGLFKKIGPKEHVFVEGWTLCGSMLGVFPVCTWTRPVRAEGSEENLGWEARVEARTTHGAIVGAAEAMCLRAEQNWRTRDDFALRSMAQTRATSKALRMPLGFVLTLAGYSATPAEEMTSEAPEEDLTAKLEESIAWAEKKKAEKEAALSPEVKEMLAKAAKNREAIEAELNAPVGVCEKCGANVKKYTAQKGHRYEQCEAARGSQAVYKEGGHAYRKLG